MHTRHKKRVFLVCGNDQPDKEGVLCNAYIVFHRILRGNEFLKQTRRYLKPANVFTAGLWQSFEILPSPIVVGVYVLGFELIGG